MANLETLDRASSLALLRTVGLGRVAWAEESGRVVVEPVNFAIDGDDVVFRTGEGEKLDAIRRGRNFSFEADQVEPALRVGWSVLMQGAAEIVTEPERLRRLADSTVSPWDESAPKPYFICIRAEHVSGRRLPLHPGGVTFVHTGRH
jgi:nitroimidazol reductase NimA-like FMN-containing flavoprotein (pyridoxamine 5'-phosphate oxidase superfamily)